jgi:ABC-type branched-subunit amino acid transport system ATPase component
MGSEPFLWTRDVCSGYGKFQILHGVSLVVRREEIVCIIGPNGSGKSTLLKTCFGLLKTWSGKIQFEGRDITSLTPYEILKMGIAFIFQRDSVLPNMSIQDNLEMGAYIRKDTDIVKKDIERLLDVYPILRSKRNDKARTLSGGQRQMLKVARALLLNPKLIILDEPTAGLAPIAVKELYKHIRELNEKGMTFFMVEQNAKTALKNSHRAYVLENGSLRFEGSGQDILSHPEVRRAYLGG